MTNENDTPDDQLAASIKEQATELNAMFEEAAKRGLTVHVDVGSAQTMGSPSRPLISIRVLRELAR